MAVETEVATLDLHPVMALLCRVTAPAAATDGEYVEMECTADPGMRTPLHLHPRADETYRVLSGTLEVHFRGEWRAVRSGESFAVPRGQVHAFRNSTGEAVRFVNRHSPALGFQDHLETVHRLIRAGKVRGTNDPRSLVYLCMSAVTHRPDVMVSPPQWLVSTLAAVGRRLGWRLE